MQHSERRAKRRRERASRQDGMPSATMTSSGSLPQGSNKLTSVAESAGTLKQVQQAFSAFQIARNQFVNSLSVGSRHGLLLSAPVVLPPRGAAFWYDLRAERPAAGVPGQVGPPERHARGADEERRDGGAVLPPGTGPRARCARRAAPATSSQQRSQPQRRRSNLYPPGRAVVFLPHGRFVRLPPFTRVPQASSRSRCSAWASSQPQTRSYPRSAWPPRSLRAAATQPAGCGMRVGCVTRCLACLRACTGGGVVRRAGQRGEQPDARQHAGAGQRQRRHQLRGGLHHGLCRARAEGRCALSSVWLGGRAGIPGKRGRGAGVVRVRAERAWGHQMARNCKGGCQAGRRVAGKALDGRPPAGRWLRNE